MPPRNAAIVQGPSSAWPRIDSGRLPGGGGDQGHDQRSEGRSEDRADQRHRADLTAEREHGLPAPSATREQSPSLGAEPAAQSDRGDDREAEEERARLAADEDEATRGDPTTAVCVQQLVVRTAQPESGVGAVQPVLAARLGGERAGDVPRVQVVGSQRGEPRVDAVVGMECRQPLERLDARRQDEERGSGRSLGGSRDVAEQARVVELGDAHAPEVDGALGEPGRPAAADLDDLAARGGAGAREPAPAKVEDVREPVDRRHLDQLPADPELAEEDDPLHVTARKCPEHASNGTVLAPVRLLAEGKPEPVDPESACARREPAQAALQRLLPRHQAPADHRDEHRERERHSRDDEQRPQRPRAQPRRRDAKRRPCCTAHHR